MSKYTKKPRTVKERRRKSFGDVWCQNSVSSSYTQVSSVSGPVSRRSVAANDLLGADDRHSPVACAVSDDLSLCSLLSTQKHSTPRAIQWNSRRILLTPRGMIQAGYPAPDDQRQPQRLAGGRHLSTESSQGQNRIVPDITTRVTRASSCKLYPKQRHRT